mmetsp:Transcript_11281/g.20493  ORF Transcript_11281/g.20493 Transcript_11281/m.20493 type:complete len:115 (+) Transcript_11281:697-1041(+)
MFDFEKTGTKEHECPYYYFKKAKNESSITCLRCVCDPSELITQMFRCHMASTAKRKGDMVNICTCNKRSSQVELCSYADAQNTVDGRVVFGVTYSGSTQFCHVCLIKLLLVVDL